MLKMFKNSFDEFKDPRKVVLLGMLVSIGVTLEIINPLNLGNNLKIRFTFLVLSIAGYATGPFGAMVSAAACDILSAYIKPTGAYFVGYTLSAALGGFIYGIVLYYRNGKIVADSIWDTVLKCIFSKVAVSLIVSVFINTLMIKFISGSDKAFSVLLTTRIIKNSITIVPEILIMIMSISAIKQNKNIKRLFY